VQFTLYKVLENGRSMRTETKGFPLYVVTPTSLQEMETNKQNQAILEQVKELLQAQLGG